MALHVVNKPLHAAVKRNPYQSGCDFWAVIWPYTVGSGTTLTNLGYRPSHNGTLSAGTWAGTDGGDGTLEGNMHAGDVTTKGPTAAAQLDYPCGAMLLWPAYTSGTRTAFITGGTSAGTGNAPGTAGNLFGMRVNMTSTGISGIELTYRKADDTLATLTCDAGATAGVPYPILVQWGSLGLSVRTPHGYAEDKSITTGIRLKSGGMVRLNSAVNADTAQALPYYNFGWADRQFEPWEAKDFLTDPALPMRDDFRNGTEFWTYNTVNPIPGRPRPTSVDWQFAGPPAAATMPSTAARVRILWSESEYLIDATATSARLITTADKDRPIIITATGLAEDSRIQWVAQWSTDGGTLWYNFAGGRGTLRDQKTTPGPFVSAKLADGHSGGVTSSAFGLDDEKWLLFNLHDTSATGTAAARRILLTLADLRKQVDIHDIAFIVLMGDDSWNDFEEQAWYKLMSILFKCGCVFGVLGNHEEESGWMQSVTDDENASRPKQRQATLRRMAKLPNPTVTTYPELGSSDDPLPTAPSALAAYTSNVDWIPNIAVDGKVTDAYDGVAKASGASNPSDYFDKFIYEPNVSGTHAQKLAYLADGLQNYYAWTWGDSLFMVLDEWRYCGFTETGGSTNNSVATYHDDVRPDTEYHRRQEPSFGARQRAHIEEWLTFGQYQHKEMLCHSKMGIFPLGLGDNKPYRRASGVVRANLCDEGKWLQDTMNTNNRVKRHWSGHDHGKAIATPVEGGVSYITCPSFGANERFTATMEAVLDYGDPGLNGSDQAGMDAHISLYGYMLYSNNGSGRIETWMRQTSVDAADLRYIYQAATLAGRFIGDEYFVASGRIYLSEVPRTVLLACDADACNYAADGDAMPINTNSGFDARRAYATDADSMAVEGVLTTGLADTDTVTIQAVDDGGEDNLTSGDYAVATHTASVINLESAAASAASVGYGRVWYREENHVIGQTQDWTRESPAMLRANAEASLNLQVYPLDWHQPYGTPEVVVGTGLNGTKVKAHYAPRSIGCRVWEQGGASGGETPSLTDTDRPTDPDYIVVGSDADVSVALDPSRAYRIMPSAVAVFYSTNGGAVVATYAESLHKGVVPALAGMKGHPVIVAGVSTLKMKTASGIARVQLVNVDGKQR